jgi:hypothetical protein
MLLKTQEGMCDTNSKRTQNEPQLSAKMRALRVRFEFSSTAQALAEAANGKDGRGRNRPAGGTQRTAREYENRGNEAKEYLKTKDITFLKVANLCAQINSNLTLKGAHDATFCENEARTDDSQRAGMTVTSSRLDKLGTSIGADPISGWVAASYRRIVVCALPLTRGPSCDRPFPLSREWGCQPPREAGWKSARWRGNGVEDKKRY